MAFISFLEWHYFFSIPNQPFKISLSSAVSLCKHTNIVLFEISRATIFTILVDLSEAIVGSQYADQRSNHLSISSNVKVPCVCLFLSYNSNGACLQFSSLMHTSEMTTLTSIPLISRLSSRVIRILGCNPGPMTLQGTNTYLVGTGYKRVLIDSGDTDTAKQYTTHLKQILIEENATIEHLIITHWHHDHIGGVKAVQNILKSENLNSSQSVVWKFSRSNDDPGGVDEEKFIGTWNSLIDEQRIEVEGAHLKIKHTPGHTTDHICLVLEEECAIFSGDCILGETSSVFEDLHNYMISLEKLLKENSKVIYPGHGPVVEDPNLKIQAYIDHRNMREKQIIAFLESTKGHKHDVMDIVQFMYTDIPKNLWLSAASNVTHHLKKLLKEDRVAFENDKWLIA